MGQPNAVGLTSIRDSLFSSIGFWSYLDQGQFVFLVLAFDFACQMNEMAMESRQRIMTSDHTTAELMCLKTQLQQTSSQLSDAQRVLAGKVSKTTLPSLHLHVPFSCIPGSSD